MFAALDEARRRVFAAMCAIPLELVETAAGSCQLAAGEALRDAEPATRPDSEGSDAVSGER